MSQSEKLLVFGYYATDQIYQCKTLNWLETQFMNLKPNEYPNIHPNPNPIQITRKYLILSA